ncbi:DUF4198 domain-containing protein [Spirosoma montaniterrae]|uniref:DUF4198 domain-containing protein n=1 Tax=Spirosoma montaniterrae TaxID=1178516 RepID=A0A1P9WTV9_9BACT|nr:DUF4198 domain-containing protein [Spirosoma montaniterrae]AQG78763.1 hypothetical protein AWR27_05130 [Spirosoma montaniterrae]
MKKNLLTAALLTVLSSALAHEFWLQPSRFFARVGESINIQVLVGEGFQGERSEGKKNRIIQYRHHTATSSADLSPALTGDHYGDVSVVLKTPGTHLFSFANTPKFLTMKADSFLLYLQEDGLDNVIAARKQQNQTNRPSRELYQRCVKTLVQVGPTPDETFAKNTGMPLEITPLQNPYRQRPGETAEFRLTFQNEPLTGGMVRYWNRDAQNKLHEERQRSDAQGRVRFKLRVGQNMISVVRMVANEDTTQADWRSYWGSLTFGCR